MSTRRKSSGGRPMDDYLLKVKKTVREHGWVAQGVFPNSAEDGLGFIYTVGLTVAGLPELIISGLFTEQGQDLVNSAAKLHLEREFTPGDTITEMANVPFRVIDAPNAEIGVAVRMYGAKARALQLVWPEADGSFPSVDQPHERQELFGGSTWWI
jgi:hypothetical protein